MAGVRPFGAWASPIGSSRASAASLRLSQPRFDDGALYWLEGRPSAGGRQGVVCDRGAGPADASPASFDVRTRVHEYGGGDYAVRDGVLVFSHFGDGCIYRCDATGGAAASLTATGAGCADFEISPDGRWLVAVEERPQPEGEPENRLVAVPLMGNGPPRVVARGHDFVSSPRFAPDGRRLAFVAWDHPQMPWDGTRLFVLDWGDEGPAGEPRFVAGGVDESVVEPTFSPAGRLTFASDRTGWWNLYQLRGDRIEPLCAREAEFARPPWVLGISSYAFVAESRILCSATHSGRDRLSELDLERGELRDLELPFSAAAGLRVEAGRACFIGASPDRAVGVWTLELASGRLREHRTTLADPPEENLLSLPEAVEFPTAGGATAHAFVYRPRNPDFQAPPGERPPLLVKSHGGPTSATLPALDLRVQYWTSRGFAVVDVNYRGSTGFGRDYRRALRGAWGQADVEDCVEAARWLAGQGGADPERFAISGGSAGGYTTLCALTFTDAFRAGASHYGIGDLEALALHTHKFESRYLDGLVGPYPECASRYRERSPIHFVDRLSCPVIFFQGLDDRVVPPAQAEAMVEALARRGIAHAYVPFEGEQHGFRRAENICTALDGELYFYSRVFDFEVDEHPEAVRIIPGAGIPDGRL
jgi:dipeptidyl aminopeptidase/acylaminoacyl peptidase